MAEKEELLSKYAKDLAEKDGKIKEMQALREDASTIHSENASLKLQLETTSREFQTIADNHKDAKTEMERRKAEWKALSQENENLKLNFSRAHDELQELSHQNQDLKREAEQRQAELASIRKELQEKINAVDELNTEMATLEEAKKQENENSKPRDIADCRLESLQDTNDSLTKQLEEKTAKLEAMEAQAKAMGDSSSQMQRNELEETVKAYERQLCSLTMNKDVTIDTLRKDLANARSRNAAEVARLTNELSKMQETNSSLKKQCDGEAIRMRDQRIYALEHTLLAQEKTVDSLRLELDQLQSSMSNAAFKRGSLNK